MEVNVLHPGNSVNDPTIKKALDSSLFNLRRRIFTTHRFGEYVPNFFMEVVPRDIISGQIGHTLRTLNLKSPMLSDLKMNRDFFLVPMQAILPFNWDKIAAIPTHGDDVPDDVYPVIENFPLKARDLVNHYAVSAAGVMAQANPVAKDFVQDVLKALIFGEMFYSTGSLLKYSGYSMDALFKAQPGSSISGVDLKTFDDVFDYIIRQLFFPQNTAAFGYIAVSFPNTPDDEAPSITYDHLNSARAIRSFIEDLRDHPSFQITSLGLQNGATVSWWNTLNNNFFKGPSSAMSYLMSGVKTPSIPLNYSRLVAYQMSMAHYCTNDKVDFVYSAELYRQLFASLMNVDDTLDKTYSFNGLSIPYDYLSGYFLNFFISNFSRCTEAALGLIFSFKHSLRYVDYFTGSRPQPLAVGDVNVSTVGNQFSILESVKKTLFARLLNAVARTGAKISNQMKDIHGASAPHDWHDPMWLGHIDSEVYGSETENTGAAQFGSTDGNSISTNLRSSNGQFAFKYQNDGVYGIIVCVTYYDIPRAYMHTTDKLMFMKDRYDMFFNQLQYQGDQILDLAEKDMGLLANSDELEDNPFGYTLRDMQYKQTFDVANGGFVKSLPSWAFLADYDYWSDGDLTQLAKNISPSYIRSRNTELDRFFQVLPGFSLGNYFHFILKENYSIEARRNMAYAPTIL